MPCKPLQTSLVLLTLENPTHLVLYIEHFRALFGVELEKHEDGIFMSWVPHMCCKMHNYTWENCFQWKKVGFGGTYFWSKIGISKNGLFLTNFCAEECSISLNFQWYPISKIIFIYGTHKGLSDAPIISKKVITF